MMNSLTENNNINKIDLTNEKSQMLMNSMMPFNLNMLMNPLAIAIEQFPDILQNYTHDQTKYALDFLYQSGNFSLINKPGVLGGFTALHWMSIKNEYDMIEFLIEKCKADVNCKAEMGETPLFIAIKNCNYLTIELLIKHGADLNARDIYNRSIVHWIAYSGRVVMLYYFQKYHSIENLNDVDQFLQNPLHIACASGFVELINYLIDSGQIDLNAQDSNGNTILHMTVKCGLPRICWKIVQQNNGECARLVNVVNKQNQKPIDLIKNEKSFQYKKLKDWLRLEARTNKYLISEKKLDKKFDKKNDELFQAESNLQQKLFWNFFKIDSTQKMRLEWQARLLSFSLALFIPILLQYYLFDKHTLSLWRGLINYSGLLAVITVISKQPHRIEHISGYENPFHIGFFSALYFHNYGTFYFNILESFNIFRFYDFLCIFFTILHTYLYYKVMTSDQGVTRENVKKHDGTPYDLRDLMKTNLRENVKYAKDSFSWLTSPGTIHGFKKPQPNPQLYFCEWCLIVQAIPSKHCKLCEGCCSKFDHHCVFINRCVGLKNHKIFINFLLTSIICEIAFLHSIVMFFIKTNKEINIMNSTHDIENQTSVFYFIFASRFHVRLVAVSLINAFTTLMVISLFLLQMAFVVYGYTTHFRPPVNFDHVSKNTTSFKHKVLFKFRNLYTFCFKSYEENEKLYYRYQKDYYANITLSNMDNGMYPRDNLNTFNYATNGNNNNNNFSKNFSNNGGRNFKDNQTVEISLD